jgi:hypothetical protein
MTKGEPLGSSSQDRRARVAAPGWTRRHPRTAWARSGPAPRRSGETSRTGSGGARPGDAVAGGRPEMRGERDRRRDRRNPRKVSHLLEEVPRQRPVEARTVGRPRVGQAGQRGRRRVGRRQRQHRPRPGLGVGIDGLRVDAAARSGLKLGRRGRMDLLFQKMQGKDWTRIKSTCLC